MQLCSCLYVTKNCNFIILQKGLINCGRGGGYIRLINCGRGGGYIKFKSILLLSFNFELL